MQPLKLFYSYAQEDKDFRDELDVHLANLKRQQLLETWYDGEIRVGAMWKQEIDQHLSTSHLIVLFFSAYYFDSDYCYCVEMKQALERHAAGTACVIPIVVRPVHWKNSLFSKLQLLPSKAKPVSSWPDRHEVWYEIVQQIEAVAIDLRTTLKTRQEKWFREGNTYINSKRYSQALTTYEQIIQVDLTLADAHTGKGKALFYLRQYKEALAACEQAIQLDPTSADAHTIRGKALCYLDRPEEALAACEQAIRLDPTSADAYIGKGYALIDLKRPEEALAACEYAVQLDPTFAEAHIIKACALFVQERYEEALAACEYAIQLDPTYASAYISKGYTLYGMKRYEEALVACEYAVQLDPTFAEAYTSLGKTLMELKRPVEALAACEHAIQLDPTFAEAYTGKGRALMELKRPKEALTAYERAIQLDPASADAHTGKGKVLSYLEGSRRKPSYEPAIELTSPPRRLTLVKATEENKDHRRLNSLAEQANNIESLHHSPQIADSE